MMSPGQVWSADSKAGVAARASDPRADGTGVGNPARAADGESRLVPDPSRIDAPFQGRETLGRPPAAPAGDAPTRDVTLVADASEPSGAGGLGERAEILPDTAVADMLFAVIGRLPGAPADALPAAGAARAAPVSAYSEAGTSTLAGDPAGGGPELESEVALYWRYSLALSVSAMGSLTLYRRHRVRCRVHGWGER
jgi:hypothetical protein